MEQIDLTISKWFDDSVDIKPQSHRDNIGLTCLDLFEPDKLFTFFLEENDPRYKEFLFDSNDFLKNLNITEIDEETEYYQKIGCVCCGRDINLLNRGRGYLECDSCDLELSDELPSIVAQHFQTQILIDIDSPDPQFDRIMSIVFEDS